MNCSVANGAGRAGTRALARALPAPLRRPTTPDGVELLPVKSKVGANYDTDWARTYPARAARVLLIGAAADYFFGNQVTSTLSALVIGAIPIERTKVTRNSADQAAALIDDGWSMLIFPEGGRSPDGWGQSFRGGAAYLSIRCEVPVVPVHVEGTGRILRKGKNVPRPSPTTVTFGDPIVPGEGEDSRRMAVRIEAAVARLADEAGSDWWQARRRAASGATPSLQGPAFGAWRRTWALGDRRPGRRRPRRSWPEV